MVASKAIFQCTDAHGSGARALASQGRGVASSAVVARLRGVIASSLPRHDSQEVLRREQAALCLGFGVASQVRQRRKSAGFFQLKALHHEGGGRHESGPSNDDNKDSTAAFSGAAGLDRQILGLAVPALLALCAEPVLSIIDSAFIGRIENPALALGGLTVATTIFDFIFRCFNFLCVVTVPLVASALTDKRLGRSGAEDPARIVGRILGLAASLGVATLVLLQLFAPYLIPLAGAPPETPLAMVADTYLRYRALALPASLVNTVVVGTFRGALDTATPLQAVLLQTIVNILLDGILVFGCPALHIPALGVQGAAIATTLSVWVSCFFSLFLLNQRALINWQATTTWWQTLGDMGTLLSGSLSQLGRTFALQVVLVQFTRIVTGLDASGLSAAAHQIGLRIWFFALFALDSIAVAAQGLVPTAAKEGGVRRARSVAFRALFWGLAGGAVSGLLLASGADFVVAAFTDDAQVRATARPLVYIVAVSQPLAGLVFTWDGIFQGLTDYAYLAIAMALASATTLLALQFDALSGSLLGVWVNSSCMRVM